MKPEFREQIADWLREFNLPEPEYDLSIPIGGQAIQLVVAFPDYQVGLQWVEDETGKKPIDGWTIWRCPSLDAIRQALAEISGQVSGEDIQGVETEAVSVATHAISGIADEQLANIYNLIDQGLWDAAEAKRAEYQHAIDHTHPAWGALEDLRRQIRRGRREAERQGPQTPQKPEIPEISVGGLLQNDAKRLERGNLPEYNLMGLFTHREGEEFYTLDAVWVAQFLAGGTSVWASTAIGHATSKEQRFIDFEQTGSEIELLDETLKQLGGRSTWVWGAAQHIAILEKWHFRTTGKKLLSDIEDSIYDLRALCQMAFPTAQRLDRPESLCQELSLAYRDANGNASVLAAMEALLNACVTQLSGQDATLQAAQKQILLKWLTADWLMSLFPAAGTPGIDDYLDTLEKRFLDFTEPVQYSSGQPEVEGLDIDTFFSKPSGYLAQITGEGYEERRGQVEFAKLVREATLHTAPHVLEAGTGIGKTIGYLVPLLLSGKRAFVATYTKNLQDQAWYKDVPLVLQAMGMAGLSRSVSILKGKNNYVCLQTVADWLEDLGDVINTTKDAYTFAAVLGWLLKTETGWLSELGSMSSPRLVASLGRDQAAPSLSERWASIDPHRKAIEAAETVDLVLTNHSYVLALAKIQSPGESTIQSIVFDEAHNIENGATETLTLHFIPWELKDELGSLLKRTSEGRITGVFRPLLEFPDVQRLEAVKTFQNCLFDLETRLVDWCNLCAQRLAEIGEGAFAEDPDNPVLFPNKEFWVPDLVSGAQSLNSALECLESAGEALQEELPKLRGLPRRLISSLGSFLQHVQENHEALTQLLDFENTDHIHWGEAWVRLDEDGVPVMIGNAAVWQAKFHSTPLDVSEWLRNILYPLYSHKVFVSATLAVGESFANILSKLGLQVDEPEKQPVTNVFPSPFEYEKQVLLSVFNDAYYPGESNDPLYIDSLARNIADLARLSKGRILVLFTSRKTLQQVGLRLRSDLENDNILVLMQTEGNRAALVERFRQSPTTGEQLVLLGLRAFWEGVDIPGDPLQILVISRLPFDYYGHPVAVARKEHYLAGGFDRDYFREIVIPNTFLHMRQMYGRLIRRQDDRGVCVFLDPRIANKQYGKHLFGLLPVSQQVVTNRARNLEQIERFLGGQTIAPEFTESEPVVTSEALSHEQRTIVDARDQRILVRAAAGSGKTRVLIERIIHLIQQGRIPDPNRILALTYTNKAQDVMNERLQNALGSKAYALSRNVLTYHKFATRILRSDYQGTGGDVKWLVEDSDEQAELFKYARQIAGISDSDLNDEDTKTVIAFAQNGLVDEEALEKAIPTLDEFSGKVARVYLAYVRRLRELDIVDYGEAIVKAVQILRSDPIKLQRWANLFEWIFCDEYQDSTPAQSMLLNLISQQANLFVVGDSAQSIYSWMGADPDNLNGFERDFPGTINYRLSKNYRSFPNLVRVSNRFLERCGQAHGIHVIWDEDRSNENQNVYYLTSADDREEAQKLAKIAKDALQLPIPGEPPRFGTVGVLARKWNLLEVLEIELIREEVPYGYEGDTAKGLRADPQLSTVIERAMNIYARSQTDQIMGDTAEGKIVTDLRAGKIILATDLLNRSRQIIGGNELDTGPYSAFRKLTGALTGKAPSVLSDLYEKSIGKGMVVLSTVHSQKGEEFDTVFVLGLEKGNTPHTPPSKHAQILEWRKVVQRLSLASWRKELDEGELQRIYEQEEQRIFYVAMTRARLNLIIGHAEFRHIFGHRRRYAASEFLDQARLPVAVREANEAYDITLAERVAKPSDGYRTDGRMYWTNAGVRVRSKSEAMLANELHRRGIYFEYELPAENVANALPDFTLPDYGGMIIEHLGLLDEEAYRQRWDQKRQEYEKIGRLYIATNEQEIQDVSAAVDRIIEQARSWASQNFGADRIGLIEKVEKIRRSGTIKIGGSVGDFMGGIFETQDLEDVSSLVILKEYAADQKSSIQSMLHIPEGSAISIESQIVEGIETEIVKPVADSICYFAYGSNMFTPRLQKRAQDAKVLCNGSLAGYALRFHKRSTDCSGKCNIVKTGDQNDIVYGVVFELPVNQKESLDAAEGLGKGYHEEILDVVTDIGLISANAYVADESAIDESLVPYTWYKALVVEGAKQHGLPDEYVIEIEKILAKEDPDPKRAAKNEALLRQHK